MKINNFKIEFDVEKYLTHRKLVYHTVGRNAMLCCPFHGESNPSFGIHIDTGVFKCFSGSCGITGNIANFIQKIERLSTYEEAELWLTSRYSVGTVAVEVPLELDFGMSKEKKLLQYVPEDTLKTLDFRHPYLRGRGIEDLWQSRFRVGYDQNKYAISMPWFDRHGRCVGIKYRSVLDKRFWWTNPNDHLNLGANKITLFGINHVFRRKETVVVIVESEIDAIYCWQNGFPAIALGTSYITKEQILELKNTYLERVIIATDNDTAGQAIASELVEKLTWIPDVTRVNWEMFPRIKDVNELNPTNLNKLISSATVMLF